MISAPRAWADDRSESVQQRLRRLRSRPSLLSATASSPSSKRSRGLPASSRCPEREKNTTAIARKAGANRQERCPANNSSHQILQDRQVRTTIRELRTI